MVIQSMRRSTRDNVPFAAVARAAGGQFTIEPVQLDPPRSDEVLVRIAALGFVILILCSVTSSYPLPCQLSWDMRGLASSSRLVPV